MARNRKVIRYRRPFHLNIGVIIFAAIFIYAGISNLTSRYLDSRFQATEYYLSEFHP